MNSPSESVWVPKKKYDALLVAGAGAGLTLIGVSAYLFQLMGSC